MKAHNFGRVIYHHVGLMKGVSIYQKRCSVGYFQGLAIQHFHQRVKYHHNSREKVKVDMESGLEASLGSRECEILSRSLRSSLTSFSGIEFINYTFGDCYESVGVAMMNVANYNITLAMSLCGLLPDKIAHTVDT